jgi:DNA-binding MarR family transcriptional regulator
MPKKSQQLIDAIQETAEQELDQSLLLSLVGYNCKRAYIHIKPMFDERMAQYDLRAVEFTVLSLLKANPNVQQKRLSAAINVSPPNLATLLDRLEARKLLVRQRNPLDKRSQALVLTAEGLRLCTQAEKTAVEVETAASSALSDAERAQLIHLLQKIA